MRIMLVAGEASGDVHGAQLASHLLARAPKARLFGMGGRRMRDAGVKLLFNPTRLSPIGFVEALRGLSLFKRLLARFADILDNQRPDVLVLIDFPGFNLPLAKLAHERGIPVLYYIAPKVWAHGKSRTQKLADYVDKLCVIFDFEREIFTQAGVDCEFVGNPLVDQCTFDGDTRAARVLLGLAPERPTVALLPGSRTQEIGSLVPVMLNTARNMQKTNALLQYVLPLAHTVERDRLEERVSKASLPITIVEGRTHEALKAADAAIVASGTATLEAALLDTPQVCIYRVSSVGYVVGRLIIKTPYIALPNIVAGRELVPELIQGKATPERIAAALSPLLGDTEAARKMRAGYAEVRARLGRPGAAGRVADAVVALAAKGLATS